MANPYINIYKDNPTAGATDGVAVSTGNSFTSPVQCTLDAEQNEHKIIPLAIRTQAGYTAQNVTIAIHGSNPRFSLSKTNDSIFGSSVTFDSIGSANQIFYAMATSQDTEQPQTDRRTKFRFSGTLKVAS